MYPPWGESKSSELTCNLLVNLCWLDTKKFILLATSVFMSSLWERDLIVWQRSSHTSSADWDHKLYLLTISFNFCCDLSLHSLAHVVDSGPVSIS